MSQLKEIDKDWVRKIEEKPRITNTDKVECKMIPTTKNQTALATIDQATLHRLEESSNHKRTINKPSMSRQLKQKSRNQPQA